MNSETYLAGVAREDITPPVGIWLCGYTVREGFSRAVDEPLTVTALVVEGTGGRVALIAMDWVLAHVPFAQVIREACAKAIGVPRSHVLINFSHSHSTPPPPEWAPYASSDQIEMQSNWANRAKDQAAKSGPNPRTVAFPVQVLRIGPLAVVGLPFEAMSETGTDLRAASPIADTWVLGYSNGIVSYLPTPKISDEGGIEAKLGYKAYLVPSELPGDWEPQIRETALNLLKGKT